LRRKVPFNGLSRDSFMKQVVKANLRPKMDRSWPTGENE
jgi:hypothetical protein